ncbi:MAG: apolipoprotein N-acyltransferase [Spirochaetes bacterium]|nr:apolipoprotein N-acyltransferase [Spirochaetota bacterium]
MNKLLAYFKKHYYLLTSVLIYFSFPSYDVWFMKGFPFFAWIALVPLFIYVRGKSVKEVFLSSFIAGLAGNFLAYEWIGNFGAAATGGYAVIVAFLIPALTVFFAIKITLAEIIARRFEPLRVIVYPAVWIIIDWIQSIGFLAYPLPYWGYSQYPWTSFIQIASITGILGINFLMVMVNYLAAELAGALPAARASLRGSLRMKETRRLGAALAVVLAAAVYGAVVLAVNDRPAGRGLRVAMVQSCISPWEDWERNRFHYLDELKRYTKDAMAEDPDFIVWSESATLETIAYDYERGTLNDFQREVLGQAQLYDRPLLTGEIGIAEIYVDPYVRRYPQNNAVLINRYGEVVKTYAKIHLVPFGEWFPYEKWLPFVKRITLSMGGSSFVPGAEPVLFEVNGRSFGVLVCYEGIFYRLCRTYRNLGAEFFVNITNDGWTDTFRGHMQHFSAAKFRAVENGIWYLRAGNTGYTAVIDPYGRITKSFPILTKGYLVGDVDFSFNHRTVYSSIGDVILYLSLGAILMLAGMLIVEKVRALKNRAR